MRDPMGSKKGFSNNINPNIKKIKKKSDLSKMKDMLSKILINPAIKTDGIKEEIKDGNEFHYGEGTKVISKNWCFTLHKPTRQDHKKLIHCLNLSDIECSIVSYEVGALGVSRHFQGYIQFTKQKRPIQFFNLKKMHFMRSKSTKEKNLRYIFGIDKGYEIGTIIHIKNIEVPADYKRADVIRFCNFYPWQKKIFNILCRKPHKRIIYWIHDNLRGCSGKTELARYLVMTQGALVLSGSANEMKHAVAMFNFEVKRYPTLILIDVNRSKNNSISYGAIEDIKNHILFSGRYNSQAITGKNPPHVVVLSNYLPNINQLTRDRWVLYQVRNNDLLLETYHEKYLSSINVLDLTDDEINLIEKQKGYDFLYNQLYECKLPKEKLITDLPIYIWDKRHIKSKEKLQELYNKQLIDPDS